MKRLFAVLLMLALCLAPAACAKNEAPQSGDASQNTPSMPDTSDVVIQEPVALDALNVEFAVGGRDPDVLLALRTTFPQTLIEALAAQNINVGKVNVTFGASDEATVEAVLSGAVDVGFLSAEAYFATAQKPLAAAVEQGEPDLSLGLVVTPADARFTDGLRRALPDLAEALTLYTGEAAGGVYTYDEALLMQLQALYESEETEFAS